MPDPEVSREEALKRLNERADALESRNSGAGRDYGGQALGQGYKILGEMIGGVAVGLALGMTVDGFAGTAPWGTIAGVLLGFGVSIWMALRTAQRIQAKAAKESDAASPASFDKDDGA